MHTCSYAAVVIVNKMRELDGDIGLTAFTPSAGTAAPTTGIQTHFLETPPLHPTVRECSDILCPSETCSKTPLAVNSFNFL